MSSDNQDAQMRALRLLIKEASTEEERVGAFFKDFLSSIQAQVEGQPSNSREHKRALTDLCSTLRCVINAYPEKNNQALTYFNIFSAGMDFGQYVAGVESVVSVEEIKALLKHEFVNKKRALGFEKKSLTKSVVRDLCQEEAKELWAQNEHKDTRLGNMCQEVWAKVYDLLSNAQSDEGQALLKELPNSNSAALRGWLKEVAPNFASKRGRPRNN